jgi:hypothetical protein
MDPTIHSTTALQTLHTRLGLLTIWCVYCNAHLLLVLTWHLSLQCSLSTLPLLSSPLFLQQDHFVSLAAQECTPRPPCAISTTVRPSLFGASRIYCFLVTPAVDPYNLPSPPDESDTDTWTGYDEDTAGDAIAATMTSDIIDTMWFFLLHNLVFFALFSEFYSIKFDCQKTLFSCQFWSCFTGENNPILWVNFYLLNEWFELVGFSFSVKNITGVLDSKRLKQNRF